MAISAFVPTEVTLTVDSVIISDINMSLGDGTPDYTTNYDKVAIICLSADRDDVHFNQVEGDTENVVAVTWYGLLIVPYIDEEIGNVTLPISITCAGVTASEDEVALDDLVTVGETITITLSESDDSGGGDAGGGGGT